MVKYRPHAMGITIDEAMEKERTFATVDEMFETLVKEMRPYGNAFSKEDLSVSKDYGKDNRIDWKETRYVCTKRMGKVIYDTPQCIGYCSYE